MCLIAFAIDAHADCPLLIAANRDEEHARPTAALHRWSLTGDIDVLGGRDLREGGTWMGLGSHGRLAMLTNVRQASAERGPRSRGELVNRCLASTADVESLLAAIDPADYAGFNLVLGDLPSRRWIWVSNRDPEAPHVAQAARLYTQMLAPGIHTVSNASLNTPWPKARRLHHAMQTALATLHEDDGWRGTLTLALADTREADAHELPSTGVPMAFERALSSPFVQLSQRAYGTRSSSLLRWHGDGRLQVEEWTHGTDGGAPRFTDDAHRQAWITVTLA